MPLNRLSNCWPTMWIAQRKLDRQPHIRGSELRFNRAVNKLNHRVNAALTMYQHLKLIHWSVKEVMSLNELKALIHERGAIDGNLGTHLPGWMRQGVVGRNVFKLLARISEERTTRTGEPDPLDVGGVLANKALEDGTVLGVNRNELARLNQRHQKVSANNNGLFVGVCQHLASLHSGQTSVNAGLSHHCVDHAVDLIQFRKRLNCLGTKACLAALWQ